MNNHSDYGYTVGLLEYRDADTCLKRAIDCENLANEYPKNRDTFLRFSAEWRKEAEYYRKV